MYLSIYKKEFDKNKTKALKKNVEEFGQEAAPAYLFDNEEHDVQVLDWDDGRIIIAVDSPIGYVSLDFKLDMDTAISIVSYYLKKLEKLAESIKSLEEFKEED